MYKSKSKSKSKSKCIKMSLRIQTWVSNTNLIDDIFEVKSISSESTDMEIEVVKEPFNERLNQNEDDIEESFNERLTQNEAAEAGEPFNERVTENEVEELNYEEVDELFVTPPVKCDDKVGEEVICKLRQIWIEIDNNNINKLDKMIITKMCEQLMKQCM